MEETDRIQKYLCESIDENAVLYRWNPKEKLSLYLAGSYQFYMTELLGEKFLLVRPYEQKTVQNIKKQMNLIHEKTAMEVALILESPTNYRIKKLLQERVPFVSINKQLYLPFLALHIQKQKRTREVKVSEKFTPATQLIYLALLYSDKKEFGLAEIVNKLDISSMTAVRGMNELVCRNLVNWHIAGQTGRKKIFSVIDKKEYWNKGREFLINPVKKVIYVETIPENVVVYKSGLTALGEQTMLGEPEQPVFAAESKMEELLKGIQISKEQAEEEASPMIEMMRYNISTLTDSEYVDPVSVMLSLRELDDRIEIAINELMEEQEWYEE